MARAGTRYLSLIVVITLALAAIAGASGTTYCVNSQAGSDINDGLSEQTAGAPL